MGLIDALPGMLTLKPTDTDAAQVFLSGWKAPESDFTWAMGPVNMVSIPLGPASEYRGRNLKFAIEVHVPLTASNPEGSRLTFMLGGTVLLEQTVKGRARLVFHAPAAATAPRLNILHITNHNPASIDGTMLGFQLYAIEIEEAPTLRPGEVLTFGQGSPHLGLLGTGWKDPEEDFCWTIGRESRLTLFFEPEEACRNEASGGVPTAEIVLSVSFHDRIDSERRHWHVLDVNTEHLLLHRQLDPGGGGLMPIRVFVPLSPQATRELILVDHGAITPARLGNDANDHTVLGFQLFTLELVRILMLPCPGLPELAALFTPGTPLSVAARRGGAHG